MSGDIQAEGGGRWNCFGVLVRTGFAGASAIVTGLGCTRTARCTAGAGIAGAGPEGNFSSAGHDMPQERPLIWEPLPAFLQQLCFERRQQAWPSSFVLVALSTTGKSHRNRIQSERHAARTRGLTRWKCPSFTFCNVPYTQPAAKYTTAEARASASAPLPRFANRDRSLQPVRREMRDLLHHLVHASPPPGFQARYRTSIPTAS